MFKDTGKISALWKRCSSKEYRDQFLNARLHSSLAAQVYFMRTSRNLTQDELALKAGTRQPSVSRIERGDAALSLKSLSSLARAFDVGLQIKFVPHSEVVEEAVYGRIENYVPSYADDIPASLCAEPALEPVNRRIYHHSPVGPSAVPAVAATRRSDFKWVSAGA